MTKYGDSLRGYSFEIHKRDDFTCQFCGFDGKASFERWLSLSSYHLLPKENRNRDNPDYIVTACMFCSIADNRFFEQVEERGLRLEGMSREQLVAQRRPYVQEVRQAYRDFWRENVE